MGLAPTMLNYDLELRDDDVLIAHISDLHFTPHKKLREKHETAWKMLNQAFTVELDGRIDMLLVTGDIVDSPHVEEYNRARDAIEALGFGLRKPYFVCPGNHDRHPKGNALGGFWRMLAGVEKNAHRAFSEAFAGNIPRYQQGNVVPLGRNGNTWTLGVFGLDSTLTADWAARGHVPEEYFAPLVRAGSAMDVDLNILLVHHHLQPIAALEARHRSSPGDLFKVTALVNAGQLSEALCRAHIDLALHGHEHESHWARYGSLERGQGECQILGAGSATGNDSLQGCDPNRASFNLIILSSDRSGRLSKLRFQAGRWFEDKRIELFAPSTLRRWRLLRSATNKVQQKPRTRLVKHVEFTRERDIIIRRQITELEPPKEREGHLLINNSSGEPVDPVVILRAPDGRFITPPVEFLRDPFDGHSWEIRWRIPDSVPTSDFTEFSLEYAWEDGALLTAQEMERFRGGDLAPGLLRLEGYEYASVQVKNIEAVSAELFVHLPEELAPERMQVFVYDETLQKNLRNEALGLENAVREIAPGQYWLSVAFPTSGHLYALAWKPIERDLVMRPPRFDDTDLPQHLVDRFVASMGREFAEAITCALYVRESTWVTERVGVRCPQGRETSEPPAIVQLDLRRTALSQAWWGAISDFLPDPEDRSSVGELSPGEYGVLAWPLMLNAGWSTAQPPWAVMRIGILDMGLADEMRTGGHAFHRRALAAMLELLTVTTSDARVAT